MKTNIHLRRAVRIGLIMGVVALMTNVIGMVETFNERDLIVGYLTLGQLLLYLPAVFGGYRTLEAGESRTVPATLLGGLVAGLAARRSGD